VRRHWCGAATLAAAILAATALAAAIAAIAAIAAAAAVAAAAVAAALAAVVTTTHTLSALIDLDLLYAWRSWSLVGREASGCAAASV
jgi:hypothetical protein